MVYSWDFAIPSVAKAIETLHFYRAWQVDCQVYLSTPAKDAVTAADRLSTCVNDINDWMTASRLRLNPTKTHIM